MGIYDGDPRLTNDRKSSRRVGKARKWLGKVGNTRKHLESVRRGSSIGHECQNMHPEPGVAHHLLPTEIMTVPSHPNKMRPKPKIKGSEKQHGQRVMSVKSIGLHIT